MPPSPPNRVVAYQIFRGKWVTFDELFAAAAQFATSVGRENLINISHSEDHNDGVVVVWFWAAPGDSTQPEAVPDEWESA